MAFKLVADLRAGLPAGVLLGVRALARFRYPVPELFAFAGLCFVLNESYSIYGGNVLSTMAGEFSFSIAISLMMLGLGLLARGLQSGRLMALAALVLALACLCHGIVLIYTAIAARRDRDLPPRWRPVVRGSATARQPTGSSPVAG